MQKGGFYISRADIEVQEDLPDFFSVLKINDAKQLIMENETMQERYGFEIYNWNVIENLQKSMDQ